MPSSQSSNLGRKIKKTEERKTMEKLLEKENFLEISLRTIQTKILHATSAKDQATQRKFVGTVICHNATIERTLGTWRKIVATKIDIKLISQRSMIKNNVRSMIIKTQPEKKEEVDTWIVAAAIIWQRKRLFSKTLTSQSKSKFDWEMAV